MDAIIGLKDELKRLFLVYFIPGALSAWPWVFIIGKWFNVHPLVDHELLKDYGTTVYIITLIFFYGSGHIIAKLGARIEVRMENLIYTCIHIKHWKKCITDKAFLSNKRIKIEEENQQFTDTWYEYLKVDYPKSEPPLFIRYYTEFIIGLKFELNCLAAIFIMLLSLLYLEHNQFMDIMTKNNLTTFSIFSIVLWFYFLYEAFQGIQMAHELRKKLVEKLRDKK
jgi:hypothetical protein